MLRFAHHFEGLNVQSLRNGQRIASLADPILNPHDLSVAAFYIQTPKNSNLVLFTTDIREVGTLGAIVDSEENLMENEDLPRLEELLELNFQLVGKKVVTDKKRNVGKVKEYVIDDKTFEIEKIHVRPPVSKLISSDLIIGRNQVVEVNDSQLIVKDTDTKSESGVRAFNPQAN